MPLQPLMHNAVGTPALLPLEESFPPALAMAPDQMSRATATLYVKKLSDDATVLIKASYEAAGFDLASAVDSCVPANGRMLIPTDIAVAVPRGTYARITPRSGLAAKHFISIGAGVVDADYRGNIQVLLFNHGDLDFQVSKGDRIAKLLVECVASPSVVGTTNLPALREELVDLDHQVVTR